MQFIQIISSFCIIDSVKTGSCMSRISPVDQDMADFMRQCKSTPAAFAWVSQEAVKDNCFFWEYDSLFLPVAKNSQCTLSVRSKPDLAQIIFSKFFISNSQPKICRNRVNIYPFRRRLSAGHMNQSFCYLFDFSVGYIYLHLNPSFIQCAYSVLMTFWATPCIVQS